MLVDKKSVQVVTQEDDMLKPLIGPQKRRYTVHITEQQYRRWKGLQKKASDRGMRLVLQEVLNEAFTKALNMAEKELSKLDD